MIAETLAQFFHKEYPPSWFIDVGVGLGMEAHEVKAKWPEIQIVGCEPITETRIAAEKAGFPGVIFPCGAYSRATDAIFMFVPDLRKYLEWGTLYNPLSNDFHPVTVAVKTLDELLGSHHRGMILWADVEGAELEVLRGAWRLLKDGDIYLINLEVRKMPLHHMACTEAEVDSFLASFGYSKVLTYNYHYGEDPHWDAIYINNAQRVME